MIFVHPTSTDDLIQAVLSFKKQIPHSVHGLDHWQRVERNALFLAKREGGNAKVVSLFALFHDSQRINDFEDPDHGVRGASLAEKFYHAGKLNISTKELELLVYACQNHTDVIQHDDPTIKCCWDGDRLDLTRVGMMPDVDCLNTETAKGLAEGMKAGDDLNTVMKRVAD